MYNKHINNNITFNDVKNNCMIEINNKKFVIGLSQFQLQF